MDRCGARDRTRARPVGAPWAEGGGRIDAAAHGAGGTSGSGTARRQASRLLRRLGIEAGEERVLFWSALALFLVSWASISVANVAETLFLKRVGVDRLPWIFLANSVLLTGTTLAAGRLAVRQEPRRLMVMTLVGLGLMLVPLWLMVLGGVTGSAAVLVLMAKQLDAVALVVFWTAVGGLVSGRQGKRLFARISAGGTLGAIFGSFTSSWLGHAFGIATLLPIATCTMVLGALAALPLLRLAPRRFHRAANPIALIDDDSGRRLIPLWRAGSLFRVLVLVSLLAGILGPILYFEFAYVADRATQGSGGEQRLLDLYALFRGWLNVGVLLIQIIGTPTVFRRLGVPLASALSPMIYLLGLAGLSIQLSLAAGVLAVAGANLQDHAVYDPAQRILVTLFPERVRAAVTTLIDGPVKRTGSVVGNLVIIGALAFGSPLWVGFAGLPIAALWLLLALVLWRLYPSLLIEVASARRNDFDDPPPLTELMDGSTLRVLERSLVSSDPERCRAACELVIEATPRRAVRALARALRVAPTTQRPLLVATLARVFAAGGSGLVHDEAAAHLAAVLAAPHGLGPLERAQLVYAYGHLRGPAAKARPVPLAAASADEHEAVRLAGIAALARVGAVAGSELDAAIMTAVTSPDPIARRIARDEMGRELCRPASSEATWDTHVALLLAQLANPDDRSHAATLLAAIAAVHGDRMTQHAAAMVAYRADADPAVRTAVLRFVGAVRHRESAPWIVAHLIADDPGEAAAARAALTGLGPAAVDVLLHTLRFSGYRLRRAVLSILGGLPIEPATLQDLVERELDRIRQTLLLSEALRKGGVHEVVLQRLHERIDEAAHTTVMLLAALLDDDRLAHAGRLVGHAQSTRDRALVLEALEALLPSNERDRLLPLLEEASPRALAKTAAAALDRELPSFDEAVREALASHDVLTHDLLRGTLPPDVLARHATVDPTQRFVPYQRRGQPVTNVDIMLHLRSLDLFAGLTTRQLAELTRVVEERMVSDGEVVVREGDFDDQMYFVVDGKVQVTKGGEVVSEIGARDFFGELAVLDGEQRSASVVANGPVHLLHLARQDLFEVMEEHPAIAVAICQTLSRRIRNLLAERTNGPASPDRE